MTGTIATIWALACLAVAVTLFAMSRRIGRMRAGACLVMLGLFLLTIEEPALTVWLAITGPGMASIITPMARAHVVDAGVFAIVAAILLGWVALRALRRGEPWARRVLTIGLVVATLTETTTTLVVFSRGLDIPGPAGDAGSNAFGWQPLAVALLAWAAGLWLARPSTDQPRLTEPTQAHASRS